MAERINLPALAQEVLHIARAQILVRYRFLDKALYTLQFTPMEGVPLCTDGLHLFYDPVALLRAYRADQTHGVRVILHALMHCLFRHMMVGSAFPRMWDLACDMAAAAVIAELDMAQLGSPEESRRELVLNAMGDQVPLLSAERIYRALVTGDQSDETLRAWEQLFSVDDHQVWRLPGSIPVPASGGGEGQPGEDDGDGDSTPPDGQDGQSPLSKAAEQLWQEIARQVQTDLETFSREQGSKAGTMTQALRALNREKVDYGDFLRRFASRCEVMRLSPDEFDYVYYTHGLNLYGDTPLVEPLEYREDKRIRDFVIAIDTSGSVEGELVQRFLQRTFNVLKQQETFRTRFNLHIIQCDARVQEDVTITTQEELDQYLEGMTLRGFGGTDFRPVFSHVEELIRQKAFTDLRGLLYFTDGYGTYPEKRTPYQTVFVFMDDETGGAHQVPVWALRVVMSGDEIRQM